GPMPKSTTAPRSPARLAPSSKALDRAAGNPRLYYDLTAVGLCSLGLLLGLGLLRPGSTGACGRVLEMAIRLFVGQAVYLAPAALIAAAVALAADYRRSTQLTTLVGVAGLGIVVVGWLHLMAWPHGGAFQSTGARFQVITGEHSDSVLRLARTSDGGLAGAL